MQIGIMFFIDLLPMILAVTAIFGMGFSYKNSRRSLDKVKIYLASMACVILIIAQTGWSYSYYILNDLLGTQWQNYAWSVFNILVMLIFNLYNVRKIK